MAAMERMSEGFGPYGLIPFAESAHILAGPKLLILSLLMSHRTNAFTLRFLTLLVATLAPIGEMHAQLNYATPYTFTTFAGIAGSQGSIDGTGSAARFNYLEDLALDREGNIYVVDSNFGNGATIRKITAAGMVTTIAGMPDGGTGSADGMGSAARFYFPSCLTVDGSGNVYVTDAANTTIRKISANGMVTTFAGTARVFGSLDGPGNMAQFNWPVGIAGDGAGNLFVADNHNYTIRKITPAAVVTTFAGSAGLSGWADGPGSVARFFVPQGVAVDGAGNLYVADGNHTIRKISPSGVVTTLAGTVNFAGAGDAADGTGGDAQFSYPIRVAVDTIGNVYVSDGNLTIRKITPAGVVTTIAGSNYNSTPADGVGSAARFSRPTGVAVDSSGNLYVADGFTIRKGVPPLIISPSGAMITITVE